MIVPWWRYGGDWWRRYSRE